MSNDPIKEFFAKAALYGVPMSHICSRAGVAGSTPVRWRKHGVGGNVATLWKLRTALDEIVEERLSA